MSTKWMRLGAALVAAMVQAGCGGLFETSGDAKVTLQIPKRASTLTKNADANGREWYRVAVRGPGMEALTLTGEIGAPIRLDVPPGEARVFSAELFDDAQLAKKTYAGQSAPVKIEAGKPAVVVVEVRRLDENGAPSLKSARIKDGAYHKGAVLEVEPVGFSDPDGDLPVYKFEWLVNGAVVAGQTGHTLNGEHFNRGDKVACRVTPGDGFADGAPVLSNEVSIGNAPPVVLSASFSEVLRTEVNAYAVPVLFDADGDQVTYELTWTVNGLPAQVEQGMEYLPSSWYERGDQVRALITPSDQVGAGTPYTLSAVVANTPPYMPPIELYYGQAPGEQQGGQGEEIGLVVVPADESYPYDPDYDELTFEFIYYRNGVEYARNGDGFLLVQPVGGEVWYVVGYASDGTDVSLPQTTNTYVGPRYVLTADLGVRAGCAVTDNDNLTCWGTGYLGDGPYTKNGKAREIPAFAGAASSVSVGSNYICAITKSGELKCWGQDNGAGQQGVGDTLPRTTPTTVAFPSGENGWVQVAAGDEHTCGLTNKGNVYCWGRGQRLGLADSLGHNAPTLPVNFGSPTRKAVAISVGKEHSCAVTDDPNAPVFCWGENDYGETGDDPQNVSNNGTPAEVQGFPTPVTVTLVAAGDDHSCAAFDDAMYCWGRNDFGQLGTGEYANSYAAMQVNGISGQFKSIAAGVESTCAAVDYYDVACWGRNRNGTFGDGSTDDSANPRWASTYMWMGVPVEVTMGGWATCYVTGTNGMYCFGYNQFGVLGNGSGLASPIPSLVPEQVWGADVIDAGDQHVCALSFSDVWCWGVGGFGQFGFNIAPSWEVFEPIMAGVPVTDMSEVVKFVATGGNHTCVVRDNGEVLCMGDNLYGQIGTGDDGGQVNEATVVLGLPQDVQSLSLGGDFSCALTSEGDAYCWGDNSFGQLGTGDEASKVPEPALVAGGHMFVTLSAGGEHACGIDNAGALYCWGRNHEGQIGDNSYLDSNVPIQIWESGATFVAAGQDFTCAIDDMDTAYCWGSNAWGKLGAGSNFSAVGFPTLVAGGFQAARIATGAYHACLLTYSGEVFCWGMNTDFQLGLPDVELLSAPGAPVSLWDQATEIVAGADFTCAVTEYGDTLCWGSNTFGQTTAYGVRTPEPVEGFYYDEGSY